MTRIQDRSGKTAEPSRLLLWLYRFVVWAAVLVVFAVVWRVFVADRFVIPTASMSPTLIPGDRIVVNKTLYGARIYKDYDFEDGMELKSFRVKGLRKIRRNDVLVFNFPVNGGRIGFKINYVYAKRCIGLPGDSIRVRDGFYLNDKAEEPLGDLEQQNLLRSVPLERIDEYVRNVMQPCDSPSEPWTVKDFGPFYVPKKGDTLRVDDSNRILYGALVDYEGGSHEDSVHVFTHDYYFMAGDNVLDSQDSRYWGLLPDDYIVGIARYILFNRDPVTGRRSFERSGRIDKQR